MKKSQSITSKLLPALAIIVLLLIWQILCMAGVISPYLLPSPVTVIKAFFGDLTLLMHHTRVTMVEAVIGLVLGVGIGYLMAVVMDAYDPLYKAFYPILVISQTVPTVAIAPLLVLWFGYGMLPKVLLIIIATFFPVVISVLTGFKSADADMIQLLESMGASKVQILEFVKMPQALGEFYSGVKISASYAVVGAVVSEWLGGYDGLGVYMTRVKKSFAFDRMFAVIFLISLVSLLLIGIIIILQKKTMPWEASEDTKEE